MRAHPSVYPNNFFDFSRPLVQADWNVQGTRLHIYKWLDIAAARKTAGSEQLHSLPVLMTEKKWTKKIHQGWSTCLAPSILESH